MNRIDLLDTIKKSRKYDIALLTTFNFEIGFFERSILNKFYDNGIRKVSLFVDSKEFIKSLNDVEYSYIGKRYHIGKRYMVTPVEMNSSFHPKVILLLAKDKARLIVGSCNLTASGYYINNEVSNVFDFDTNNIEYLSLIQTAMNFFININEETDKRDNELIQRIKGYAYYDVPTSNNNIQILHNLNRSLIDQINDLIEDEVNYIDIAVPYFDKELSGLNVLKEKFSKANINLFIQNEKSTFPINYIDKYNINVYDKFNDNNSGNFYHGKVIRFKTSTSSYIAYGSANCTQSALTKSKLDNGNVECDVFVKGELNEFDYYFDNFCILEDVELISEVITFDNKDKNNFLYIENVGNTLLFKYKEQIENLEIKYEDIILDYEYNNDKLHINISIENLEELSDIFELSFIYDDRVEKIKCYFIDKEILESNRNQLMINYIPDINVSPDPNATPDKYLSDRSYLLSNFGPMYDILNEKLDYYIKDTSSEDSEVADERQDFIDYNFKLSDEIQNKKKTFEQVVKAKRHIFHTFREHLLSISSHSNNNSFENTEPNGNKKSRVATSSKKLFARLVKRIIRDMLDKKNSSKLDFSNYITSVVLIFETFNKFMIRERIDDMFTSDEVIKYQYDLIKELSTKIDTNINEEEAEMFIWLALASIIQINYINKDEDKVDYKRNIRNRDLLRTINDKFNIRENFDKYLLVSVSFINEGNSKIDINSAHNYIEELFDYKTNNQLLETLKREFGNDAEISMLDSEVIISTKTDSIKFKYNKSIITEIRKNYKSNNNQLKKIVLVQENIKTDYDTNADKVDTLTFVFDEVDRKVIRKIIRKSGKEEIN